MSRSRELLIANVSWWAGWCTDHEVELPELTQLSGLLMEVKDQMRKDRPGESVSHPSGPVSLEDLRLTRREAQALAWDQGHIAGQNYERESETVEDGETGAHAYYYALDTNPYRVGPVGTEQKK